MYVTRPSWYYGLVEMLEEAELEPAFQIVIDGVPLLKIFRLDPTHSLTRKWVALALAGPNAAAREPPNAVPDRS